MEEKKIEITSDEFMEKAAKVAMTDKGIRGMIDEHPTILMVLGLYTAAVAYALFEETEEENQED